MKDQKYYFTGSVKTELKKGAAGYGGAVNSWAVKSERQQADEAWRAFEKALKSKYLKSK